MPFNPFKKGAGGKKKPSVDSILEKLVDMEPNSANCSLLKTAQGEESSEDLGRAFIFKHGDKPLIQNKTFYISTPDAIKAEENPSFFKGKDEIIHLWFLHNRTPWTVERWGGLSSPMRSGEIWTPDSLWVTL